MEGKTVITSPQGAASEKLNRARFQIYEAICKGAGVERVEELLKQGHSPNRSPPGCFPPIYRAVRFNKPGIALCLLRADCRIEIPRRLASYASPIICIAADLNMTEVVRMLCVNPTCDVFARDSELQSFVHIAVVRRNYELLQCLPTLLINPRKFLTLRDGSGKTPLHIAASKHGNLTLLRLLLQMDRCHDSKSVCDKSVCKKPEIQSELHEHSERQSCKSHSFGSDINLDISDKAKNNCDIQCDKCDTIIRKKPDIDSEPHKHSEAERHSRKSHSLDSDFDSDIITDNVTSNGDILSERIPAVDQWGDHDDDTRGVHDNTSVTVKGTMRRELIDLPVLGTKKTLLHFAAEGRQVELMEFLISRGANVNALDIMRNTPLHTLFMESKADHRGLAAARLLLKAGADLALQGIAEKSPIKDYLPATVADVAVIRNRVAFLKLLGEFGQRLDGVVNNTYDDTLFTLALRCGSEEVARFLLTSHPEHGRFHARVDRRGNTPLHLVVHCKSKAGDLTKLMLEQGYGTATQADLWPRHSCACFAMTSVSYSRPGDWLPHPAQTFTPLTWAIRHRQLDVVQRLVTHDPTCLLTGFKHQHQSPLHVTLEWLTDEKCIPFIDFFLMHGSDGNEAVCGETPYEYVVRRRGRDGKDGGIFSVGYLRRKLGASFLKADPEHGKHHVKVVDSIFLDHEVTDPPPAPRKRHWLELRDLCENVVRQRVRATGGDFYADVSSLPLPSSVIRHLLFITKCID